MEIAPRHSGWTGRLPALAAILVTTISLAVLAGWATGIAVLKSTVPGWIAMTPNTAIAFLFSAASLWLAQPGRAEGRRKLARLGGLALVVVPSLILSQDLFTWDMGIDRLLMPQAGAVVGTMHPGRFAPNTAVCFIVLGLSLLLLTGTAQRRVRVLLLVQCAAALVAGLAALALVNYAVDMPMDVRWRNITPMAFPTAIGFFAMAAGLFATARAEFAEWAIGRRVTAAIVGCLLLMLLLSGLSSKATIVMEKTNRQLVQTSNIRFQNSRVLEALERLETAQRGYLLTGHPSFLRSYHLSRERLPQELDELRRLTRNNGGQQRRVAGIERLVATRVEFARETLAVYGSEGEAGAVRRVASGQGERLMEAIRSEVAKIDAAEQRLSARYQARAAQVSLTVFALLPAGALIGLLILSVGLLLLNREVCERAHAEKERDRFFTMSLDLLCIAGADGYFKRVNPALLATLGWSREELLARPFLDFIHPDDHAATQVQVERQIQAGESVLELEHRFSHRDGSWRLLSWRSVPHGHLMYGTGRDITAQRQTEDEMARLAAQQRESEAQIRLLLDSTGEAIYGIDADGLCTFSNPACASLLGYGNSEELLGRDMHSLIHHSWSDGRPYPVEECQIYRGVHGNTATHADDEVFWRADGSSFAAEYRAHPICREGKVIGAVVTFLDISKRKQAEASILALNAELEANARQLTQANGELESFSYSVSHDLRAPLRHIEGFAQMLVEDAHDELPPEGQRYLDNIIASARRMGLLIDDLLAFSRLGRKPISRQAVDMRALVESVLADLRKNASGSVGAARIDVAPLPAVGGDPALLRQVWANLLSNALKYSAPRGDQARIEVSGERRGDHVHYSVSDNGAGFDMRYADKLFGVFQRLHGQDEFEGTGVGLAIVQRIIHRHGGQVSATGEVDRGACFSFELPIQEGLA